MRKVSIDVTNTGELNDGQLDAVVGGATSLAGATPLRISSNITTPRATPGVDFGDKVKAGLEAGVVADGAAVTSGMIPGGAILSAAVSSVGVMTNNTSSTVAACYG